MSSCARRPRIPRGMLSRPHQRLDGKPVAWGDRLPPQRIGLGAAELGMVMPDANVGSCSDAASTNMPFIPPLP